MINKLNFSFLFNNLDDKQKPIWCKTGLQSFLLMIVLFCIVCIMKYSDKHNIIYTALDVGLVIGAIGFSYFVIMLAIKNVMYSKSKISNLAIQNGIWLVILCVFLILLFVFYWNSPVFISDKNRISFAVFILSGIVMNISNMISTWILLIKNQKLMM